MTVNEPRPIRRRTLLAVAGIAVAGTGAAIGSWSLLDGQDRFSAFAAGGRYRTARTATELIDLAASAQAGDCIALVSGTVYTLSETLEVAGTDVVLAGGGATLRLSADAKREAGRVLDLSGTRCVVKDLRIVSPLSRGTASRDSWIVQITGAQNVVERCAVHGACLYAIGVAAGSGHKIRDNTVTGGGGIAYAWNGSQQVVAQGNTVTGSTGNAFSGVGNNDRITSRGNVVRDNAVRDCGRIAIEDWNNISGSLIEGNRIERSRFMGISAVGARTTVRNNTVTDPGEDYGIETGASHNVVSGNTLTWSTGSTSAATATGITVNNRWRHGDGPRYTGFLSQHNTITGPLVGISLAGSLPDIRLDSDTITGCLMRGISLEPTAAESVQVRSATIRFDGPAPAGTIRDGVSVAHIGPAVVIDGSTVTYGRASAGRTQDYFVRVESAGVTVKGCSFDASGRRDARRPKIGSVAGLDVSRIRASGNRYAG